MLAVFDQRPRQGIGKDAGGKLEGETRALALLSDGVAGFQPAFDRQAGIRMAGEINVTCLVQLAHRLKTMIAVGRPVAIVVAHDHDRIEEAADLLNHRHQSLDVWFLGIALIGRVLDALDGKHGDNDECP